MWIVPALSMALYAAALTQPAVQSHTAGTVAGWRLLLQGWRGLSSGYLEWLANPVLLASWWALLLDHPRAARFTAATALVLMLVFPLRTLLTPATAGLTTSVHGAGWWLWVGSAVVMMAGAAGRFEHRIGDQA